MSILTDKSSISSEEVKTLFQHLQKQMQENQNELRAEIQQLMNATTGELSCTCMLHKRVSMQPNITLYMHR